MQGGSGGASPPKQPEGVEKEILGEAPPHFLQRPRSGDVATVELEVAEGVAAASRTWALGTGKPLVVADLDIDSCVYSMRVGERAFFKPSAAKEPGAGTKLRLVSFERHEDLLGDGSLLRTRIFDGVEREEEAEPGLELRIRFSWRPAPPRGRLDPEAEPREGEAEAEPCEGEEEAATSTVLLAGDPVRRAEAASSQEMQDLRRTLLQHLPGAVVVRGDDAPASKPVLSVSRAGKTLLESTEGLEVAEACHQLQASLAPPSAPHAKAAYSEPREATVSLQDGNCRCKAADWLRGYVGMRALVGIRAGQRCLLRVVPHHAFGTDGLPDLGLPGGVELEYGVEVLQAVEVEDVSAHLCWGRKGVATKRTLRSGEGLPCSVEGSNARIRVSVREGTSGAELVAERELDLAVASGHVCAAVDEILPMMKQGEVCEVHCSDAALCLDTSMGLQLADGAQAIFQLELLSFERLDLHSLSVPDKMAYCLQRKEVGTRFFQEGLQHLDRRCAWFLALKRYRQAVVLLFGLDSWTVEEREAALSLRRLCRLNMAACWLKLEAWEEAERSCSLVLKEEPENPKALFRKGQALSGMGDHAGAKQCAKTLLQVDPKNREAARLLAKAQQALKAAAEQLKDMQVRMAQGIAAASEAAAPSPSSSRQPPAAAAATRQPSASKPSPPAAADTEEPTAITVNASEAPLWPWALAALAVSLSAVLALRWRRQRAPGA